MKHYVVKGRGLAGYWQVMACFILLLLVGQPAWAEKLIGLQSGVLPAHPQRVVVLEFVFAESLAALGIAPVGMVDTQIYPEWIGYDNARFAKTADVGTRQQPSLEAIAKLKPDLIIGMSYRHAALFDALRRIAPTVLYEYTPPSRETDQFQHMLAIFDSVAQITGKAAQGAAVKQLLSAKLQQNRQRLAAAGLTGSEFILMQELGLPDRYWAFTANSTAGGVAKVLGLHIWPAELTREGTTYLTVAQLMQRPATDYLMMGSMTGPEQTLASKLTSPVWPYVPMRKANHVALLERNIWVFGGPMSAGKLADRITETLLSTKGH